MAKLTSIKVRQPHRGAGGDLAVFAQRFLEDRFVGFEKDIAICLTGRPAQNRSGLTYAYFPALMACCGTLEYLACMYHGRRKCNDRQVSSFAAEFMPQPTYNGEGVRLLFEGFRHKVAHHGIASGVWHDRRHNRRISWAIGPDQSPPAIQLRGDARDLVSDPPWPCPVTHTAEIHLGRLAQDTRDAALGPHGYCVALHASRTLLDRFEQCMVHMYPR